MGLGSWASPRQRSWRSGRSGRSAMLPNCSVESSAQMAWSTMKHSKILKISEMHHGSWLFRFIQLFMAIHGRIFFWIFMLFSFFLFQGTASYDLHLDCHGLIKYPHENLARRLKMKKVDGIQHYSALIGESTELDRFRGAFPMQGVGTLCDHFVCLEWSLADSGWPGPTVFSDQGTGAAAWRPGCWVSPI